MCPRRIVPVERGTAFVPVMLDEHAAFVRSGTFIFGSHGHVQFLGDTHPQLSSLMRCRGPLRLELWGKDKEGRSAFRPHLECPGCQINVDQRVHVNLPQRGPTDWYKELMRCAYALAVPPIRSMPILGLSLIQGVDEVHPCFNTQLVEPNASDRALLLAFAAGRGFQELALTASFEIIYALAEASKTHEQAVKSVLGF